MTADGWLPAAVNGGWTYRDRVPAELAGVSASAFYAQRHRHSEALLWRQRLKAGEISRNGEVLRGDAELAAGDRLAWRRPGWREEAVPAAWAVVHDDGDLLVLDKPSGLPVLPAGGWLEHTVLRLLERRHQGDAAGVPRPVHRLGRFTSGLLVCARRSATRAWLSAALRESTRAGMDAMASDSCPGSVALPGATLHADRSAHPAQEARVRKLYRALLQPGRLRLEPGDALEITTPIGRRPHPLLGVIWCAGQEGVSGDLACHSTLTLLQRRPEADLVQVAIDSGRPHQIRIHCASIGAPLRGDPLYRAGGGADPEALPGDGGYSLQAWRLELRRPAGERLVLQVPQGLGEASCLSD